MRRPENECGYCEQDIDNNEESVSKGRFSVHESCDVAYFMNNACVDTAHSKRMAANAATPCGAV